LKLARQLLLVILRLMEPK